VYEAPPFLRFSVSFPFQPIPTMRILLPLVAFLALTFSGVAQTNTTEAPPPWTYNASDVKTTASGMQYVIIKQGTGAVPTAGQMVTANYHGTFPADGRVFDSSFQRGQPFQFRLGAGQVIRGWDEAFAMFPIGTRAVIILPPSLAYGERGAGGVIPPNATLRFDVELVGAQ
jgi:peptidylprolyl isomerase